MRRARFLIAAALLTGGCGGPDSRDMSAGEVARELAGLRIEPGLWELSTEVVDVRAPNLPSEVRSRMLGRRPPTRHCITPEQAARPDANFLAVRGNGDCRYRDFAMEGSRLTGSMTCAGTDAREPVTARMDGRYEPRRYDMRMEMESPMPTGVTMTLVVRSSGRRIGDCP